VFIRTNDRGATSAWLPRRRHSGRDHWTELIPHRDGVMLEEMDLFARFFIACEREDGLPKLSLWRFGGDGPEAVRRAKSPSRAGL